MYLPLWHHMALVRDKGHFKCIAELSVAGSSRAAVEGKITGNWSLCFFFLSLKRYKYSSDNLLVIDDMSACDSGVRFRRRRIILF